MTKIVSPKVEFNGLLAQVKNITPEIFDNEGNFLNLVGGEWKFSGKPRDFVSCVDGSRLGALPMLSREETLAAVEFASAEFRAWSKTDLDERKRLVNNCLELLTQNVDLIAYLLMWEIGKTYALAHTDISRCIEGVQWYVANIDKMMKNRTPLGLVSNIASWNYPFSVLMHAALAQLLAGNSIIAKTPTDGGFISLSFAFALARRCGLPVSLVSGSGGELSEILVRNQHIDCLSFVGGRSSGRDIAASLIDKNKRYMLEMEGVNTYGVWDFSDWSALERQLKKGYDYGKQRCTAYVRFVVQRSLFPKFLETHLSVLRSLRIGNPTLVDHVDDNLPNLDFGPVIKAKQVQDLDNLYANALQRGATPLFEGELNDELFLPNQNRNAYAVPRSLVDLPKSAELYFREPFGPIDSIVLVNRIEELVGEMNISNGALVAALASDDEKLVKHTAKEIRAFKVGINTMRSRGDKQEVFGGMGESWKGCFVGGNLLIEAVTNSDNGEPLKGNFDDFTILPEQR